MPPAVVAALTGELGLLSTPTRTLLGGAAVAGDPFEPELAAVAAGVSEESAVLALDELLTLELVRPTDVPRRFRFRHPLVRRAVYETAPGGWLLGAHERCATALGGARRFGPPARAHHVEHAARHGDAAALAVLLEADRRPHFVRPRAPHDGLALRCASCRTARRLRPAGRATACARRGPRRHRPTPGKPKQRPHREHRPRSGRSWSRCVSGSRSPVPAWSTCSAATRESPRSHHGRS